jgi:hypothetical protein
MFILDTHIYKLRFRINTDAPTDYMNRWKKLKYDCDNGNNKYIIEKMKKYCKLESNKTLPYLQRAEGGFGGNDNIMNKQIRFRICWCNSNNSQISDNDIILDQVDNESECVNGVIEISNKKSMSDDYLDSDDESG